MGAAPSWVGTATARAGVAGNPSDALGGAALAVPVPALTATVTVRDADRHHRARRGGRTRADIGVGAGAPHRAPGSRRGRAARDRHDRDVAPLARRPRSCTRRRPVRGGVVHRHPSLGRPGRVERAGDRDAASAVCPVAGRADARGDRAAGAAGRGRRAGHRRRVDGSGGAGPGGADPGRPSGRPGRRDPADGGRRAGRTDRARGRVGSPRRVAVRSPARLAPRSSRRGRARGRALHRRAGGDRTSGGGGIAQRRRSTTWSMPSTSRARCATGWARSTTAHGCSSTPPGRRVASRRQRARVAQS